jgi:hypothetical protein
LLRNAAVQLWCFTIKCAQSFLERKRASARVGHGPMAKRAAAVPNLSGLAQGNAQESPLKDLPAEIWRMIVEFSHAPVDEDDGPAIGLTCDRLVDACKVAKDAPWGSNDATCGPNGFLYDRANALMGFYRDANDWKTFSAWAALQPQVPGNHAWLANPRAYFRKCCEEFQYRIRAYGTDLRSAFLVLIRGTDRRVQSWSRAFLEYCLRRDPRLLMDLPKALAISSPAYLRDDYTHLAKIALALDGTTLRYVPGAARWWDGDRPMRLQPSNGYTDAEFAELARIAIHSRFGGAAEALGYVPGAMNDGNTIRSRPANPHFASLAREAIQIEAYAMEKVPGNISYNGALRDYNPDVIQTPIAEYVELATLAVKKQPMVLEMVPGVLFEPSHKATSGYPSRADRLRNDWNGHGWVQTNQGTLTDDDFVAIAKAAIKEARERFADPWTFNNDVYFFIPPRLRERVLGSELLAQAQQRFAP